MKSASFRSHNSSIWKSPPSQIFFMDALPSDDIHTYIFFNGQTPINVLSYYNNYRPDDGRFPVPSLDSDPAAGGCQPAGQLGCPAHSTHSEIYIHSINRCGNWACSIKRDPPPLINGRIGIVGSVKTSLTLKTSFKQFNFKLVSKITRLYTYTDPLYYSVNTSYIYISYRS